MIARLLLLTVILPAFLLGCGGHGPAAVETPSPTLYITVLPDSGRTKSVQVTDVAQTIPPSFFTPRASEPATFGFGIGFESYTVRVTGRDASAGAIWTYDIRVQGVNQDATIDMNQLP
jgi:hypothetical protein